MAGIRASYRLLATVAFGMVILIVGSAQASAYVYWSNTGATPNSIGRATLQGTGVNESFVPGLATPVGVTTDSTYIYWTDQGSDSIGRANLDGSNPEPNFIVLPSTANPSGVAVTATTIYWTNTGTLGVPNTTGVGKANIDGGGVVQSFIPTPGWDSANGIVITGNYLYWTSWSGQRIARATLDASSVDLSFIAAAGSPLGIAADSGHLYWANNLGNTIARSNLDGSGVDLGFITGPASSFTMGVAVGANYIYWANDSGTIGRAQLNGDGPVIGPNNSFMTAMPEIGSLAVDQLAPPVAQTTTCRVVPRKLSAYRSSSLVKPGCKTNAGQRVGVRATVSKVGRGDVVFYRLFCQQGSKAPTRTSSTGYGDGSRYCKKGALKIRPLGQNVTIKIAWSAPAKSGYNAMKLTKSYRVRD